MSHRRMQITSTGSQYAEAWDGAERFTRDLKNKPQTLPRRTLLTHAGISLFAFTLPISICGCDDATLLTFILEAAQFVAKAIKGEVKIDNPNEACRTYEMLITLYNTGRDAFGAQGRTASRGITDFRACDVDSITAPLERANLIPEAAGRYVLAANYDDRDWDSGSFDVSYL